LRDADARRRAASSSRASPSASRLKWHLKSLQAIPS
jgi:hypothetical protein